jgi:hypothetical protein
VLLLLLESLAIVLCTIYVHIFKVSDSGMVIHLNASHGENVVFRSARNETGEVRLLPGYAE